MGNQSDKISENEVHHLNMITIFQKDEIKKFYKDFLKKWPDGYMDLQTFKEFFRGIFHENMEDFAEHYFRNIDRFSTGKIKFSDFLIYLSAEGSTNPCDRITWLFDLFDIDESGFIDRKEMAAIFKSALVLTKEYTEAGSAAEQITDDIFERYDKDKNEAIEKHELQDAILEKPESFTMFPVLYKAIFKTLSHE